MLPSLLPQTYQQNAVELSHPSLYFIVASYSYFMFRVKQKDPQSYLSAHDFYNSSSKGVSNIFIS